MGKEFGHWKEPPPPPPPKKNTRAIMISVLSGQYVLDLIDKWSKREDEWGSLVNKMQRDRTFQEACGLVWDYKTLRMSLMVGFRLLDQLSEREDFLTPPPILDEVVEEEFNTLQKTCKHWKKDQPISRACRKMSLNEPYLTTQRTLYHKYPNLRCMFKLFNSCLDKCLRV